MRVSSISERVQRALEDSDRPHVLSSLLACFQEAHWGASRRPGTWRPTPGSDLARDVALPSTFADWAASHRDELTAPPASAETHVHLPCCLETDTFVLAIEDATGGPQPTGTASYPARHRLSLVIEAVRALADGRLYGVGVVAREGFDEPRRAAILEGLPHLEREEAEDLYAAYWGWCTPTRLKEALDAR